MHKQKSLSLYFLRGLLVTVVTFLMIPVLSSLGLFGKEDTTAYAVANSTINFQARLLTTAGSVVPDGQYNVEFKLYTASSSSGSSQGSCTSDAACVWTETRISSDKVRVVNGYMTVNLGSVTAFATSINWDQELWLTMNIGGTGSPGWDGEMNPRLKLTAVPYAFKANQLANTNGANRSTLSWATQTASNNILLPNEAGTLCIQASSSCGFATGSATSYIQNQSASPQTANFNIQGVNTSTNTATIRSVASQDNDLFQFQSSAGTPVAGIRPSGAIYSAAINNPITDIPANARLFVQPVSNTSTAIVARAASGGAPTGDIAQFQNAAGTTNLFTIGAAGATTITNASSSAFRIQDGSSNAIFTVNGSNSQVGIGNITPSYALDVVNDINSSTAIRVAGNIVCDSTGCTAKSGSGFYIHNQTTVQASNMYVQAATTGSVAAKLQAFNGGSGDILDFLNGAGVLVGSVNSVGSVLVKPSTNSTSAFQVQPSGSATPAFNVDTSNARVGIGTATPTRALDVLVSDASESTLPLIVRQSGTGDSGMEIKTAAQSYYVGVDASDSGKFKIASSSAAGTATLGTDTVGSLTDSGDSNFMNAMQVTAGASGTLSTLYANIGTTLGTSPNNQGQMAIYTNNAGVPGTLLSNSSSTTLASGWNSFALSSPVNIVNGTIYWIAYNTNGTTSAQNNLRYESTGGTVRYTGQTFGTWPGTFPAGTSSSFKFSMYGTVQAASGTDSFTNNLFQLTTNGQATFKNNSNSTTAFQIQNTGTTSLFTADTSNSVIQIGSATTDASAVLLILDSYNQAVDPTGIVGAMYYNTNTGNFRCYTATKWNNCGGLMLSTTNSATITSCTTACGPVATAPSVWVPDFCTVGRVVHMYASGVYGATATATLSLSLYIGTSTTKASDTVLGAVANTITPGGATAYGWEFDGYIICNSTTSVVVHGTTSFLVNPTVGDTVDSKIYTTTATAITNTAQSLYLFPTWSASSATNTITANQFIVETM